MTTKSKLSSVVNNTGILPLNGGKKINNISIENEKKVKSTDNVKYKKTTPALSEEEIMQKLIDYVKVDNINEVKLNTHLRYFVLESNKQNGTIKRVFRLGGFLTNKDNSDKYVVLSNGRTTWSVQTINAVFYRKMSMSEVKEEYENDLEKMEKLNKKLLKQNEKLKHIITDAGINYRNI